MKSRITKLAAAVIIIAVLAGLPFIGGRKSGIALADVLEKIERSRAYMYTKKMTITGKLIPGIQESTIQVVVSADYGMKLYVENTDPNTGRIMTHQVYILPEKKMSITIIPEKKRYARVEFDDYYLDRIKKQYNDPREIIKQIMKCDYTELGRSVVDGVEVEGFRTTDPAFVGEVLSETTSIELTLWVDVENWLPFHSEMEFNIMGEKMQRTAATYDYRWNIPVHPSDFEPLIPDDFKHSSTDDMKINEAAAIEGLRRFAEITGRYPKALNKLELVREITAIKDSQYMKVRLQKLKDQMSDQMTKDEIPDALVKKLMEIMRPIQSIGYFTALVTDKKEAAYYGESVGPDNPDMVLLRWKVSDNQYRVIFGDLTAVKVTADELNELER